MSGTPAKPAPPVDAARLMEFRRQSRSFDEIDAAMGLKRGEGKAFYIHIVRSNANKARRSQRGKP